MKAVMAYVPEHMMEWRRRNGADQWDEKIFLRPAWHWYATSASMVESVA